MQRKKPDAKLSNRTLFLEQKIDIAIKRMQHFVPEEGFFLAFSGGKDSMVLKRVADMAGVKYDAHYSVTTIDPPEVTQFMKEYYPDVQFDYPDLTFFQWMQKKLFPPTRLMRWCCEKLKERGGEGRLIATGIRWAESVNRAKNRTLIDTCYKRPSTKLFNPLIDWTDVDIWDFIHTEGLPYCKLYDQGVLRIGCILCPMAGPEGMKRDIERYPKMANAFRVNFQKLWDARIKAGKETTNWKNAEEWFDWWIGGYKIPKGDDLGLEDEESEPGFMWYQ